MSDEQNKDSLLVDQKDALGFYFDALLLPDENDLFDNDAVLDESKSSDVLSDQDTSNTQEILESELAETVDTLQADKDFLRASKLRQGVIQEKVSPDPVPELQSKPYVEPVQQVTNIAQEKQENNNESVEKAQNKNILPVSPSSFKSAGPSNVLEPKSSRQSEKIITAGPVSPKPRLKEPEPEKQAVKKEVPVRQTTHVNKSSSPEIVFSTKNNDGEVSEQVLIPRSQRLAAAKKSGQAHSVAKVTPQPKIKAAQTQSETVLLQDKNDKGIDRKPQIVSEMNNIGLQDKQTSLNEKPLEDKKSSVEQKVPLENDRAPVTKKNTAKGQVSSSQEEAPRIDLSLFLPKIKTLSEEEIAQQIEALTQAAVSQAQLESDLAHVAELEQVSQKILNTQAEPEKERAIQNIENAPSWAVPNFQVLLFTVSGLKLAVPLTELNGIVEWGDEYISELPGHKSWYLGIIQNQGKSVPVIDTLQQVVPQNRWPANHLTERKFKHIIMIDNSRWGLACERVLEVVTLNTDAVKWRSTRTKRRWLMGTVIEHMCALLDSSEFASMLKTGDDSLMNT